MQNDIFFFFLIFIFNHIFQGHKMLLKPTFWLDYNMSANKKQMDSLKEKPKQT